MADITKEVLLSALQTYIDPYLQTDLITAKALQNIDCKQGQVTLDVCVGFPSKTYQNKLIAAVTAKLSNVAGVASVQCHVTSKIQNYGVQPGIKNLSTVKNIIAVASGKGGVGKSTVAVNLALGLSIEGAKVGILDADIYGPSQPMMLGATTKPESTDNKLEPIVRHGLQSMSIGYLIDSDTPMVWRGPMVSSALQQLLNDTNWQELDYLIIDLPPGTGDIQLTLAQKIPVSGAVIVTTPQDIALLDAKKAIAMFNKVRIPVLGVVENMSYHICNHCGHQEHIFGQGGGESLARQHQVDLLGSLPLDKKIREQADGGNPTVIAEPDGEIARQYREIALRLAAKLSLQAKNYTSRFPKIVIEDN